jgi:hypothetical protein
MKESMGTTYQWSRWFGGTLGRRQCRTASSKQWDAALVGLIGTQSGGGRGGETNLKKVK